MNKLRIHYIQHVPFEGLGYIETWAQENGHSLSSTKQYEETIFPKVEDYDWLIVMGGPMGVYEEDKHSWLATEKECIKNAIFSNKTVIGICLGAQLIANVLGAKVYPNDTKEIGWFPISLTSLAEKNNLFKDFPTTFPVLHWHGDTFELPKRAVHLMKTTVCTNQAFLYNDKVLGLQFHLEATPETLVEMIEHFGDELVIGKFIQSATTITDGQDVCKQNNTQLSLLLDRLAIS